ncbi:MAG TPA: universal stress protein [Polyangiaceae bacterium]|nr:universal stress protein [Polyangiaceae bacterium]
MARDPGQDPTSERELGFEKHAAGEAEPLRNTDMDPNVILCAVDGSNGASRVVSMAARLARAFPVAQLHVLHVFRTSRFDRAHAGAAVPPNTDALADAKEHLEFHVRAARAQCRNSITGHFQVGDPPTEVLRLVAELKAQLLVIGTHDHAGFERLILGSTAETLMRKAGCSVLVVRPLKYH